MSQPANIKSLSLSEIISWCKLHGHPSYRAGQIYEWIWQKGITAFDEMKNLPLALRQQLEEDFILEQLRLDTHQLSSDGTEKFSFITASNDIVEGVLIPSEDRATACISTQAGCALGCKFCATGQLGFQRNLMAWEIYDQVFYINNISLQRFGHKLSNIVYMGMGEPFLNFDAVKESILRITDMEKGLGMSPQRITVSTVGIPEGVRRFADELPTIQLALSLHIAHQQRREELMPVAKKYTLEDITNALIYYHEKTNGRIIIEYILLGGYNDTERDMQDLARFCKSFPVKINLIPYNKVSGSAFSGANNEKTRTFIRFLKDRNLVVNARKSRGSDIAAACGQLARKNVTNNTNNEEEHQS